MDKPKHKDGMLAAGKKRLEQFRQKKQGKGSASKQIKPETDIEHGRLGVDAEHTSLKGSKAEGSMKHTSSDDLEAANNRSDSSNEAPINLKVVSADDVASQINTEHSFTCDLDHGSAYSFNSEEYALEQCREAVGNSEVCLRMDSLDSLGVHLSSNPPITGFSETPIEQERLAGGFDSGRVSVTPDLSMNMADLVVPDINVNCDLVNNGDGTTELNGESIVMNSFSSDHTETVQACDKEQKLMSSLESGAAGMPLCSSTTQPDLIAADTKSELGDEKASELHVDTEHSQEADEKVSELHVDTEHSQKAEFTGSNCSDCVTPPDVLISSQSTLRGDEESTSGPGHDLNNGAVGMLPGFSSTSANLECMGIATQVMNKEQELSSSSDAEVGTIHLSDLKSDPENDIDTAHLAVLLRPEVDLPPVSEGPSRAHGLELPYEDIVKDSGPVEYSNMDQPRTEELNDTRPEVELPPLSGPPSGAHALELHYEDIVKDSGSVECSNMEQPRTEELNDTNSDSGAKGMPLDSRPEVDLPPFSEDSSGAHALELDYEDTVMDPGPVEDSNMEQPPTEEFNDTKSDSGVKGMPLDSSLNQAEVGLNNDSGLKESSDDSYQGGMRVELREDMTNIAGAEKATVAEVSEPADGIVQSDCVCAGALEHEKTVLSLCTGELTASSYGIGEDATSVTLMEDTGEPSVLHFSEEVLNSNIVLDKIPETTVERGSNSSGFCENIEAEVSLRDDKVTTVNTDQTTVSGTAVHPGQGVKEFVYVESIINPIQESLSGDGFSCSRSLQIVEAEQDSGEDQIMKTSASLIEGGVDNTGNMEVDHCSAIPSEFKGSEEHTSELNSPEGIVTSGAFHHSTAVFSNTHILVSDNDSGFLDSIMGIQGDAKARSEEEVDMDIPLDSGLVPSWKTEEVQGVVEEVVTNDGSDSSMGEMALQLRMDKVVEELVPGHNLAEVVTRPVTEMEPTLEFSSGSSKHEGGGLDQGESLCCSQELYRSEVSFESKIDEPDSALCASAVDHGDLNSSENNVDDGVLGSTYMQHEVDTSPALDAEVSLANTTEQRTDNGLSGNGSSKHESDIVPSPCKSDLPLELISIAVHHQEVDSDSDVTKSFQSSLDAEPILDFNPAENQEHVLTSDVTVGDHVEVIGTISEKGQEPVDVSQFEPAVQPCSMSKPEMDSVISDSCKSYEVMSIVASPGNYGIELPLVMSPNKALEGETEHLSLNPLSQELSSDFGADVNQNVFQFEPAVQSCSMSKPEIDSFISDSCKSYEVMSIVASPGNYGIELPLVMSPNKALEGETEHFSLNPLSQELSSDFGADVNQNGPVRSAFQSAQEGDLLTGQESKGSEKSELPLENVQEGLLLTGHESRGFGDLPLINEAGLRNENLGIGVLQHVEDEGFEEQCRSNKMGLTISCGNEGGVNKEKELEDVIRELRDSLCTKETELENLSSLLSSQAAKNSEEQDMALKVLRHVVNRLGHLVCQGSNVNEDADLHAQHLKPFDDGIQGAESINLDGFLRACDHWMDKMQKGLEEKMHMEVTGRQLEDELLMKDTDIEGLIKKVKELSQNCDELQKESEQKQHLECHVGQLEELLAIRDMDIRRLSDKLSELSQSHDLAMGEAAKAVEEKLNLEGELKYFQELHAEKESRASLLEDLISIKDTDLERLSDKLSELSQNCDELQKESEQKQHLESHVGQLEELLAIRDMDIGRLSDKLSELSQSHDLAMGEAAKALEKKLNLEGELNYFQELHAEKESRASLLEDLISIKDTDLERLSDKVAELSQNYDMAMGEVTKSVEERLSLAGELNDLQRLYAEQEEERLRMYKQASALTDKVSALLSPPSIAIETVNGDAFGTLGILVASLQEHYETVCRENKDLLLRASGSDAANEVEVKNLRALILAKEEELAHVQEKVECLTNELSKTKEEGERRVQEAEQKALGVRERLSLAVTKGKGLVQQRDNLKHLLAEKTAELEALPSYKQELHAMKVALNEAEIKVKLNSEAVERVEALESELSYIRNSANALRESFLQKDAVLQKIEELLEDANLPEELQIKDIYEKVEWLLEAYTQQTSTSKEHGDSETVATRGMDTISVAEQASQMQEIEQLNRKCDELLRKYRGMAEQSAMLEQSLLERNLLIQRWEEMLDAVDMPASVRSKEPEDKIEWLGTAVSDAHASIAHLQAETESLQTTVDNLKHALQKLQDENGVVQTTVDNLNHALHMLQDENGVLSVELVAKDNELRAIAANLEDMTSKGNSLLRPTEESSDEIDMSLPQAGVRGLEESECKQEASQQTQFQVEDLEAFITNIRTLLSEVVQENEVDKIFSGVPASTAFETSVKLLVENSKVWSAEATDTKGKLVELTSALRVAENELQSLHEALSLKTLELSNLTMQLEDLAAKNTLLEDEVDNLQRKVEVKTEELSRARDELDKSQLEVSQGEGKLASVREKLSMAVKKGKSVVQQRDALKQSLEEKTAELSQLRKEQEVENIALNKAKQSLKHQLQQVEMLEAELSSSRSYASSLEKSLQESNRATQKFAEALDKISISGAPRSGELLEKIQWISHLVMDLQKKAGISEQEAKKSKKATELLALELEEVQGRMESLADEFMHAEKNISLLIEEKKSAEASKAEAGLRLEHAMANINSLLFELSESRETQANLEQENNSLKDSLSAQMDEIRYKQTKAEDQHKELTDLYNKVHALKANQSIFLGKAADQVLKSSEDIRGIKTLLLRISGELKDQGLIPLPNAPAFVEISPSKWQSEFLKMEKMNQEWKQGATTDSLKLLCEEMEIELQHFDSFFKSFTMASNQDSVAMSQLLLEICGGLGPLSQKMQTLKRDADFASSTDSLIAQKDEQIKVLGELLKAVAERVRSSVEEMEVFKGEAVGQVSRSGISAPQLLDDKMPFTSFENLQAGTVSLVERLSSTAKDHIQNEKQIEDLRNQLSKAKSVIDAMDQQQQIDKLKINELQKCLEELKEKEGILKRTNQELSSLHDVLSTRKQEEEGLVEALNKAETKIGELSSKVEELEKAKQELEASLGKASSRFYSTVNNFNKFQSLSEKLIEEAESLHLLLEDRDAQISLLKEEVTSLQNLVNEKTADLSELYQQIGGIVNRDGGSSEPLSDLGIERQTGSGKELIEALATSVRVGTDGLRVQLARKDALLQDVQLRHDDLVRKVTVLESSLMENQRLMEERGHANVTERMMISVEAEEKGNRGKHATPSVAVVTHGRGGRKVSASSDHLALDVDTESSRLLVDVDDEDKGHVFKPLTSSRLVPRGTRILVDRLDGFWVYGERLLRRRPGARLSVMLYWLVLHIWMVATLL